MNAFDKLKIKHMPANYKIIFDSQTGLFLKTYSTSLPNCTWDVPLNAMHFNGTETQTPQQQADAAITSWGETPGQRFIGSNPAPH